MVLDVKSEIFDMHIGVLEAPLLGLTIHLSRRAQIGDESAQIAALNQNKAPIKVLAKYSNFANMFLAKEVLVLLKEIELNKYAIKLEEAKQLSYRLICSLGLVELENLKTYIKIYLKTGFI